MGIIAPTQGECILYRRRLASNDRGTWSDLICKALDKEIRWTKVKVVSRVCIRVELDVVTRGKEIASAT
jgi:hypothetical protein